MSTIAAAQPWLIEVEPQQSTKAEKSLWDQVREMHALGKEVGGLVQPSMAAALLDVSRGRVYELMKEGRFTVHDCMEQKFLEMREVQAYYASERKAGRPKMTFKQRMKRALSVGEECAEAHFGGEKK